MHNKKLLVPKQFGYVLGQVPGVRNEINIHVD